MGLKPEPGYGMFGQIFVSFREIIYTFIFNFLYAIFHFCKQNVPLTSLIYLFIFVFLSFVNSLFWSASVSAYVAAVPAVSQRSCPELCSKHLSSSMLTPDHPSVSSFPWFTVTPLNVCLIVPLQFETVTGCVEISTVVLKSYTVYSEVGRVGLCVLLVGA